MTLQVKMEHKKEVQHGKHSRPPSDEGGGSRQRDGGRESRSPTNQNRKPGSIRYELPNLFFEGFCGGEGEFFCRERQKRGDVRERPLCGMQRALRMCPVLGCAETASLPVANIAASQNASKTRFAMRDAKTATGKRRRFLSKRASSPSIRALLQKCPPPAPALPPQ